MRYPQTIDELKHAVILFNAILHKTWCQNLVSGDIKLSPEMRAIAYDLSEKYGLDIGFTDNQNQRYSLEQLPENISNFKIEFEPFYISIYKNWETYLARKDNQIDFKGPFYLDLDKEFICSKDSNNLSTIAHKYFSLLETINFLRDISCSSKERECIFYYHKQNMKFDFTYSFADIATLEISDKQEKLRSIFIPKEKVPLYEDKIRIFRHLLWKRCFQLDTNQNKLILFHSVIESFFQDFEIECELVFDKFSLDSVFDKLDIEIRNLQKRINDNLSSIQGNLL